MKEEIRIELSKPLQYHTDAGQVEKSSSIILYAPSKKHMKNCVLLKEYFFATTRGGANEAASDTPDIKDSSDITGQELMASMYVQGGADMNAVLETGLRLFASKGIAKIDGVAPLTEEHLDKICVDDLEMMLGEYLVNFILASILRMTKEA